MHVLGGKAPLQIDRYLELPSIPLMLIRILQEMSDDATSSRKFEDLILHDPALSARILRLANSAYYSFRSEVKTISHAIVLLGIDLVRSLALGMSLFDHFAKDVRFYADLINKLWIHSFGVGLLAKEIWKRRDNRKESEFAFLCGLLHDLGMVVFFTEDPIHYSLLFGIEKSEKDSAISALEVDHYGVDHAYIGGMLAKEWDFPSELAVVMGKHHDVPNSCPSLVYAVSISDMLAKQTNLGFDGDNKIIADIPKLRAHIGMREEEYKEMMRFADLNRSQAEGFFMPAPRIRPSRE